SVKLEMYRYPVTGLALAAATDEIDWCPGLIPIAFLGSGLMMNRSWFAAYLDIRPMTHALTKFGIQITATIAAKTAMPKLKYALRRCPTIN
ncbi:MAG: hypothetical protein WCS42_24900, partial [Verrucomicrobiota bacterium]